MKKIIIYILLTLLLAYLVREILYIGVRKNKIGEYDKLNTLFIKPSNKYNTLILGSSRAEAHFHPFFIDSISGLNTYNAGMEGEFMPLILGTLQGYLENNRAPQNIILSLDVHPFTFRKMLVNRFPRFFPYLNNKALFKKLSEVDPRFVWFKRMPFYSMPYFNDKYLNASFRGFMGIESTFDQAFFKGYVPVPEYMNQNFDTISDKPFYSMPDKSIFRSLDSIIQIVHQNNSHLIFVITPTYYKGTRAVINNDSLANVFKIIATRHNIPVMDYTKDSICYNQGYFADYYHLNKKGSEVFSLKFAMDLRQYLKNP